MKDYLNSHVNIYLSTFKKVKLKAEKTITKH